MSQLEYHRRPKPTYKQKAEQILEQQQIQIAGPVYYVEDKGIQKQ